MPDDRIYDAINLFKFSPTGLGRRSVGGDATYEARYRKLASDVVAKLWDLWGRDRIAFKSLPYGTIVRWGQSLDGRLRSRIDISNHLEPTWGGKEVWYIDPVPQSKLAAASLILCHEAVHHVLDAQYPEEETMCRMLALLYYEDITDGEPYAVVSKVTNDRIEPRLSGDSSEVVVLLAQLDAQRRWYQRGQLIDYVLNDTAEYRPSLTAEWIARSITWWGGITNRWLTTRGYYLDVVVQRGSGAHAELILRLLESVATPGDWALTRRGIPDLRRFRRRLASTYARSDAGFARRLRTVGWRIGEDFWTDLV